MLTNFILTNDFSDEKVEELKESLSLTDKQLIRELFKFLNSKIGTIENNSYF